MAGDAEKMQRCVGIKQCREAVLKGRAEKALVALDADCHVKNPFLELCEHKGVPVQFFANKTELGKFCRIDVGAACAVILL